MKTLTIVLLAIFVLLPVAWYFSRADKGTTRSGSTILVVGTSSDYPPFTCIKEGELVGYEIDVVKEIANRLHKEIEFKDMAFTNLIPEMQFGNIQIVAAGMTPSEERAKRILFTSPIIVGDPLVIVTTAQQPINNLEDLRSKEVVVNEGFTADCYMTEWGRATLNRLTSPADAFLALKSGRAVAYVDAKAAVKPFFDMEGSDKFKMIIIPDTGNNSALGISLKHAELLPEIQKAIENMQADGTLDALKKKWGLA